MLAEPPVVRLSQPGSVDGTIEANNRINAAVRAERGLPNRLAVGPVGDRRRGELAEAIEARSSLARE